MPKETIVILDDERYIQWTLKELLGGEKYTILSSDSIEKVLSIFLQCEVACLITECWINHFCTFELIRTLKERFPEVYVMMLTSKEVSEEKYEEMMSAGVDDFFTKPFSAEKILLHLKKGLRQRTILLQKKRLEEELQRMNPRRDRGGFSSKEENAQL